MRLSIALITAALAISMASCQPEPEPPQSVSTPLPPPTVQVAEIEKRTSSPTIINHRPTFEKILGNSGISLQWISWDAQDRGKLDVRTVGASYFLAGQQQLSSQPGRLFIEGAIKQVDEDAFIFDGVISITDTPGKGRNCRKEGESRFAITQGRKYFRMREFEWCDRLTDYVDIYF